MTNIPHKVICTIIIGPYLAVVALMCVTMLIGPLIIATTLVVIGCVGLFFQRINFYLVLCKWHIERWWWSKRKTF